MKNQIRKYGSSNVFVLTARMQEAADPIHKWLKSKGINIPFKNITGHDRLPEILKGIEILQDIGFKNIKINAVLLNGINSSRKDFDEWSKFI